MDTGTTRDLVTRMYAAATSGDLETLGTILSPDFVAEEPDFLPYGGTHSGFEAFIGLFAEVSKVIDLSELELEGLTVEGEFAYARVTAPLVDGSGAAHILEEWQVRDGLVTAARVFWLHDPRTN